MELPCIVTDIPGCNEIISHDVNGWLVKPKCIDALESAMNDFLSLDNAKLLSVKKEASENIKTNFERSFYQKKLLNFYNKVLEND
jgi:glycosyltransferase involved in cell wall biosynthesis